MKREHTIWLLIFVLAAGYIGWRVTTKGAGCVYQPVGDGVLEPAWEQEAGTARLDVARTAGVWVAAVLTLCILSFAYRDNPFYKIAESILVGVSAAYWMVVAFWTTLVPNLFGKLVPGAISAWAMPGLSPVRTDDWLLYAIPLVLGGMLLWRLAPKGAWIARWPLAFIIGTTAGIRLLGFVQADFISQIRNTIRPLAAVTEGVEVDSFGAAMGNLDAGATIYSLLLVFGIACCLVYFFFSIEHKGVAGKAAKIGIWYLMITFGAAFGFTVMGRIALLAIRLEFLFNDWLWLIDPAGVRPPGWTGWW